MSLLTLMLLIFIAPTFMVAMTQPLLLTLTLLIFSLLVSLLTSLSFFPIFGYALFLIFISGMLVLFAYISSLVPNMLHWDTHPVLFFISLNITLVSMTVLLNPPSLMFTAPTPSPFPEKTSALWGGEAQQIFQQVNLPLLWLLATILFIVLVAVVKICFIYKAPLRPFN
uniref:NADH dehydrogenase subunit 6 n=1 Tax=Laevipilina antarctica TaxID=358449 RepID=A0A1L6BZY2_9MOLL|nr:NADH dehydrogenase subunit 6 [Laevipilina antarctica]APQ42959.1 NADH dehydrogenase subunit 6 [Laevipilina antarctica]